MIFVICTTILDLPITSEPNFAIVTEAILSELVS